MKIRVGLIVILAVVSLTPFASGGIIGQIDTFQDGTTDGWFAGGLGLGMVPPIPPQVVANGGPMGIGDRYLQITGLGGDGAGSRIVAINAAQWTGNYLSSGISGIGMDLKNFGSTALTIRLLFEDPMMAPPNDEAVTTLGISLPVGSGWTHAFYPISPSSMTVVMGDVNTLLSNTTLLRIIHSPTPGDAVSVVGVLGVDNISTVPEPATWLTAIGFLGCIAVRLRRASRPA